VTGLLVPFEPRGDGSREPVDPGGFAASSANRANELPATRRAPSVSARPVASGRFERFSWPTIAAETVELYRRFL